MKLDDVEKILKISISQKELEKYTSAINGILSGVNDEEFNVNDDFGTLRSFFEWLIKMIEDSRNY